MQKSHGYRKLALLISLVFVTGMFLAACSSSSQSSTDEGLSHPGENYLGTIKMEMDPIGESIKITKIADAVTDTTVSEVAGFEVSSSNVSWNGAGTLTGDIAFKWTGPERLEDVSIRVYDADATGLNATIDTDDVCGGATIGAATSGGCNPGLVYVADEGTDGAETETTRGLRLIPPGCGAGLGTSVAATWSMTETGAGMTNPYTFYAHAYATLHPQDVRDDPRWDPDVASIHVATYEMDYNTALFPWLDPNAPINVVAPGQWFYAAVHWDAPGDQSRGQTANACADGNGDTWCSTTNAIDGTGLASCQYDFFFMEDQAAFDMLTASGLWQSFSFFNSGFMFMAGSTYRMQWDPAIIELAANGGYTDSGTTRLMTIRDYDSSSGEQVSQGTTAYNQTNAYVMYESVPSWDYSATPPTHPPLPDGLDGWDYGNGFQQGDYNAGQIAFHAIGPSGSGTSIRFAPSGNTIFNVATGVQNKDGLSAYPAAVTQKSPSWPIWGFAGDGPSNSLGHYNEQIGWICIQ